MVRRSFGRAWSAPLVALVLCLGVSVVVVGVAGAAIPPTSWATRQVPPPSTDQPHAELAAASCPTARFCLAVGDHIALDGSRQPLVETWHPTRGWRLSPTTGLPARAGLLDHVSCADPSWCIAFGGHSSASVVRWNGTSWAALALPHPKLSSAADVSCAARAVCVMVGNQWKPGHPYKQSANAWRLTGGQWTSIGVPDSAATDLFGLDCPAQGHCYAVGQRAASSAPRTRAVVDRWDGTRWTSLALPTMTKPSALSDISCPAAHACTAVGEQSKLGYGGAPMVATLSDGRWHIGLPFPDRPDSEMGAVSCRTDRTCTAVVSRQGSDEDIHWAVAVRGSTGGFHVVLASKGTLRDVSCTTGACTVVGSTYLSVKGGQELSDGPTTPIAVRHLTRRLLPAPPGTVDNILGAVSCTAKGFCAAAADQGKPAALVRPAPGPWRRSPGGGSAPLTGVSCTSAAFCMAVRHGHSKAWDGANWTSHPMPTPNGSDRDLVFDVSCVSPSWCDAVGTTGSASFPRRPLVEHWDGSAWTVVPSPALAGTFRYVALQAISCTSTTACLAVGYDDYDFKPVVESWNGSDWSLASDTGLSARAALDSVSCWAADACLVASSEYTGPLRTALVDLWNGSTFTRTTIAGPSGTHQPTVLGVACRSETACVAVGYDGDHLRALVQSWNGTSWHIVTGPTIHASQSEFTSVSCATSRCVAVGDAVRYNWVSISAVIS
jgi:hypothetical protein